MTINRREKSGGHSMKIYGIQSLNYGFIDTSKTLIGAKSYATRHGYTIVGCRSNCGYTITEMHEKINGKWVEL